MTSFMKSWLRKTFPNAIGAFHAYRHSRSLRARSLRETPLGFRFRGHAAMEDGSFEPRETALIGELATAGSVFVDVGANFGYYVCLARRGGAHVLAIEPHPTNLELLYGNLAVNGWSDVEVFPVGVAAAPGLGTIYGAGTGASLLPRWAGVSELWRTTIPLSTLDILLGDRFDGVPMLIKVDVEGAEDSVLDGAERTLGRRNAPRWIVEICLTENYAAGACNQNYAATFDRFFRRGYRARSIEAGLREVTPDDVAHWAATGHREFGYVDFLFEKP